MAMAINFRTILLFLIFPLPVPTHRLCHTYKILGSCSARAFHGTFASRIDRSSNLRNTAKDMWSHFEKVERFLKSGTMQAIPHCEDIGKLLVKQRQKRRDAPVKYCGLQYITDLSSSFTAGKVFTTVLRFAEMIQTLAPSVLSSYRVTWASSFSTMTTKFNAPDKYREYSLVKAVAYRLREAETSVWGMTADVKNISPTVAAYKRAVLSELVFSMGGHYTHLPFRVAGCSLQCVTLDCHRKTTTPEKGLRDDNSSATKMTIFGPIPFVQFVPRQGMNVPVMKLALKYGNLEKRRVQESDSLPILAVLFIPALLSLFPLAFFQEASLVATLN